MPAIRAETTRVRSRSARPPPAWRRGAGPVRHQQISTSDLKKIFPFAILAIGILLALVLRSLVAPLYLIASVGLSYLAALGLSVLVFIKLGNSGGLSSSCRS